MLVVRFLLAMLPILWLMIALSVLKMAGHKACLIALLMTTALAIGYWNLNFVLTLSATLEGILNALWPICLVIVAALFTYNISLKTGGMDIIKQMLAGVSTDKRVLALLIGWGFGNFMEGMAGFGTAVAIPASMLAGIGIDPFSAVLGCLVVNSTPTVFGSVGVPAVTLATVTGVDVLPLSGDIAVIQVLLTFLSPFLLVCICGKGVRALRGMLPTILTASLSFIIPWFITAAYIGPELPNIIGSICSMLCMIAVTKIFRKQPSPDFTIDASDSTEKTCSASSRLKAWSPFILIFVLLTGTSTLCPPIHDAFSGIKSQIVVYAGEGGNTLSFSWINTPGVMIFAAAVIGGLIQGASIAEMTVVLGETFKTYWKTILTICSVMAIAKIMSYSGMISDIAGMLVVLAGPFYPFISPLIGGLGGFVTGSGTSACVLFGGLQTQTATKLGLNPSWMAAANIMGAGIGKMISPQGIAIGAGAINAVGSESKILRAVFKYFVFYILIAGVICLIGSVIRI